MIKARDQRHHPIWGGNWHAKGTQRNPWPEGHRPHRLYAVVIEAYKGCHFDIINGHFRNRLIGGTYHKKNAYCLGLNFREYPQKIWSYMLQYLHFRILKFPVILGTSVLGDPRTTGPTFLSSPSSRQGDDKSGATSHAIQTSVRLDFSKWQQTYRPWVKTHPGGHQNSW